MKSEKYKFHFETSKDNMYFIIFLFIIFTFITNYSPWRG